MAFGTRKRKMRDKRQTKEVGMMDEREMCNQNFGSKSFFFMHITVNGDCMRCLSLSLSLAETHTIHSGCTADNNTKEQHKTSIIFQILKWTSKHC